MNPDDQTNADRMLSLIRSVGVSVSFTRDRLGIYHVNATDQDGQEYHLTGERLYPLTVELAEQVGFEDLD